MWSIFNRSLAIGLLLLQVALCVNLGIERDGNTQGLNYFRWGSIATWNDDSAINTNNKLAGLAKQACKEMRADWPTDTTSKTYVPRKKRPEVMSALRVDNSVYFSSSIKGYNFVYVDKTGQDINTNQVCDEIQLAMQRCVQAHRDEDSDSDGRHGNNANCGDVMALQSYCKARPDDPINTKGAVLVTYNCKADPPAGQTESSDWFVSSPCEGRANSYGCALLLKKADVDGVKQEGTTPEDPTVDPNTKVKSCIWG